MVIEDMQALLDLFEEYVPDKESNRAVFRYCDSRANWPRANTLFSTVHEKNLEAIENRENVLECQYSFEEVVAKTLFNMTDPTEPFEPDAPYWVIKNAITLAKALDLSPEEVIDTIFRDESF